MESTNKKTKANDEAETVDCRRRGKHLLGTDAAWREHYQGPLSSAGGVVSGVSTVAITSSKTTLIFNLRQIQCAF